MKLSEAVIPISEAKARTAGLVRDVVSSQRPVIITQNGRAQVIVQDLRSYEATQESLALLKIIALGRVDVRDGRTKPLKRAFRDVRRAVREKHTH
jgi:prevent-host-death family protein